MPAITEIRRSIREALGNTRPSELLHMTSLRWQTVAASIGFAAGLALLASSGYDHFVASAPERIQAEAQAALESPPPIPERVATARVLATQLPRELGTPIASLDWPAVEATITSDTAMDARRAFNEQANYQTTLARMEQESGLTQRNSSNGAAAMVGALSAGMAAALYFIRDPA